MQEFFADIIFIALLILVLILIVLLLITHQPSHHHYSRRQEVLAGTERWIRLHDLIIKGELAPDVSSNKIRFDKCCMNIYVDDDIPDG